MTTTNTTKSSTATKKVSTSKKQVGRKHMAQEKIDFSRVSNDIKNNVYTFEVCLRETARLGEDLKQETKSFNERVATIDARCEREGRERTAEEVAEVEKLEKEYNKYYAEISEKKKDLSNLMNTCADRIIDVEMDGKKIDLYAAYKQVIEAGKRGEFLLACTAFMKHIGCVDMEDDKTNANSKAIRKVCEIFRDHMAAKVVSGKALLTDDNDMLTTFISRTAFKRLFVATFRDILVSNRVIDIRPGAKRTKEVRVTLYKNGEKETVVQEETAVMPDKVTKTTTKRKTKTAAPVKETVKADDTAKGNTETTKVSGLVKETETKELVTA